MVLLALLHLGEEAYGVTVVDEIHRRTGRDVMRPAVYVALRRLEQKALVSSRVGAPRPERGGRARKHYTVTAEGLRLVREARTAWMSMWDGLQPLLEP